MAPAEDRNEDGQGNPPDLGDSVDMVTFGQILEMDESEDDRDFSQSIVFGFFEQAEETFNDMAKALEAKDLHKLALLGHFLKGSSATLGLVKVREHCANIERYGKKENPDGSAEPDEELCLRRITETLKALRSDYADVEKILQRFFGTATNGA